MAVSKDALVNAGFPEDNWPDDLPAPGESNITNEVISDSQEKYRYEAEVGGQTYAMEVVLDTSTVPDPAEGVTFMLNQFAFLWRSDKEQVATKPDGSARKINF